MQLENIYNKKIEEMETVREKTRWLLLHYPHTRNCDKCLIFRYWAYVDGLDVLAGTTINTFSLDSELIHKLTPAESITRARRLIQKKEKVLLPTDSKVLIGRNISQLAMKDYCANAPLEEK